MYGINEERVELWTNFRTRPTGASSWVHTCCDNRWNRLNVSDYVKPILQCRRRRACIEKGNRWGKGKGNGEEGGRGGSVYSQPGITADRDCTTT